jgi:hypothetical protein
MMIQTSLNKKNQCSNLFNRWVYLLGLGLLICACGSGSSESFEKNERADFGSVNIGSFPVDLPSDDRPVYIEPRNNFLNLMVVNNPCNNEESYCGAKGCEKVFDDYVNNQIDPTIEDPLQYLNLACRFVSCEDLFSPLDLFGFNHMNFNLFCEEDAQTKTTTCTLIFPEKEEGSETDPICPLEPDEGYHPELIPG